VQFTPAQQTRHGQDRLVASSWRYDCIPTYTHTERTRKLKRLHSSVHVINIYRNSQPKSCKNVTNCARGFLGVGGGQRLQFSLDTPLGSSATTPSVGIRGRQAGTGDMDDAQTERVSEQLICGTSARYRLSVQCPRT